MCKSDDILYYLIFKAHVLFVTAITVFVAHFPVFRAIGNGISPATDKKERDNLWVFEYNYSKRYQTWESGESGGCYHEI